MHLLIIVVVQKERMWPQDASLQYQLHTPDEEEIVRDIVERPKSVLLFPVSQKGTVLLIEEYDLGSETWQLTIPGEK